MSRLCVYIEIALVLASVTGQTTAPMYDAKGNMILNDRGYGFAYDFENRLTKVYTDSNHNGQWDSGEAVHARYTYDALGHRVIATIGGVSTLRIFDRDDLIAEFGPQSFPFLWLAWRTFVNGTAAPDEKLLVRDFTGKEYYFLQDHLGSISALANAKGRLGANYAYDAYGTPIAGNPEGDMNGDGRVDVSELLIMAGTWGKSYGQPGYDGRADLDGDNWVDVSDLLILAECFGEPAGDSSFGFTGQEIEYLDDAQLILYNYKARVYDPVLGRFLQRDPVEAADQYNLYEYVKGRPTVSRDPTGRFSFAEVGVTFAIGSLLNAGVSFVAFGERSPQKLVINALLSGVAAVATGGTANIIKDVVSSIFIRTGLVAVSAGTVGYLQSIAAQYLAGEPVDTRKAKWAAVTAAFAGGLVYVGGWASGGEDAGRLWDIATGIASEQAGATAAEIYEFLMKVEKKLASGSSI